MCQFLPALESLEFSAARVVRRLLQVKAQRQPINRMQGKIEARAISRVGGFV
jgi:hypothetical protein